MEMERFASWMGLDENLSVLLSECVGGGIEMPHGWYLVPKERFLGFFFWRHARGGTLRRMRGGNVKEPPIRLSLNKLFAFSSLHLIGRKLFARYIALFDMREEPQTQKVNPEFSCRLEDV